MTLTIGTGPFGDRAAGRFDFERPSGTVRYVERSPRRVRGTVDGRTVVDSKRVLLLHSTGELPRWYFPLADVRPDAIEDEDRMEDRDGLGEARLLTVGTDRSGTAWTHEDAAMEELNGHAAFEWQAMDAWYEEDEQVYVHPRDPYHRVDAIRSSRRVAVELGGETVAESTSPVMLFETGLPERYYLPPEDVRAEVLRPSDERTECPYKGTASYHHVEVGGERHEDIVWYYPHPLREVEKISGLLCFYNEKVNLTVDGDRLERPVSKFP